MSEFDPVPWDVIEATSGPPASEVTEMVETIGEDVADEDPYDAVKAIHDALYDDGVERTVPSLGEPFVTAYLLEREGIVTPVEEGGREYRSLVERRPDRERLRELFWERERTLWWIGMLAGVHPSLVTYWMYEDDVPLMERNLTDESLAAVRAHRESDDG